MKKFMIYFIVIVAFLAAGQESQAAALEEQPKAEEAVVSPKDDSSQLIKSENDEGIIDIDDIFPPDKYEAIVNWRVQESESLMGDAKNILIFALSPITHNTGYANKQQAVIRITCRFNKTEMMVSLGTTASGLYDQDVEYRLDDGPIIKTNWNLSTDWQAVFAKKPILFIRDMMKAKRLVLRTQTRSAGTIETYFNLEGLEEAIKPVQAECGWK